MRQIERARWEHLRPDDKESANSLILLLSCTPCSDSFIQIVFFLESIKLNTLERYQIGTEPTNRNNAPHQKAVGMVTI